MAGRKKRKSYQASHSPEWEVARFAEHADAQDPNRRFFVYVLGTSYGTYVGHTYNVLQRLEHHKGGRSTSTRGGKPVFLWASNAFNTREEVLLLEARLKGLRDTQNPEFAEITGVQPTPFDTPRLRKRARNQDRTALEKYYPTRLRKRTRNLARTSATHRSYRPSPYSGSGTGNDSGNMLAKVIVAVFFVLLLLILLLDLMLS